MRRLNRRGFLEKAAKGAIAIPAAKALSAPFMEMPPDLATNGMAYRKLGRTGFDVSEISLGGSPLPEWGLLRQAIERGVNYIDTSHTYSNGNSERQIGRLLKEVGRDTVRFGTKFHLRRGWSEAGIIRSVEASLRRVDVETIDVLLIHGAENPDDLTDERVLAAFEKMKKRGMYRYRGLSCHANHAAVVKRAVTCGLYDMVQVGYNVFDIQKDERTPEVYDDYLGECGLRPVLADAHRAGVGVIAMKTLKVGGRRQDLERWRTGKTSLFQAMLKWVLENPHVASVCTEMLNQRQLDEDLAVVGGALTRRERHNLFRHVAETGRNYCHQCGRCQEVCPTGIRTTEIFRALAYAEQYAKPERARLEYARLPRSEGSEACAGCEACSDACPFGVDVRGTLERARCVLTMR